MSTHNLCFAQKYEKYQNFLSENFQFLEVEFSIYLNKCVFVMFFWCLRRLCIVIVAFPWYLHLHFSMDKMHCNHKKLLKNIDCKYWLELPHWGSSNEYPQSMF